MNAIKLTITIWHCGFCNAEHRTEVDADKCCLCRNCGQYPKDTSRWQWCSTCTACTVATHLSDRRRGLKDSRRKAEDHADAIVKLEAERDNLKAAGKWPKRILKRDNDK